MFVCANINVQYSDQSSRDSVAHSQIAISTYQTFEAAPDTRIKRGRMVGAI